MPFVGDAIVVSRHGDHHWRLENDLLYQGREDAFVISAGFVTDFATVPRIVVWLIPRFGRYTAAAILHDWLLKTELAARRITSHDADGLFRRVMREQGVSWLRRWLMWAGVRWAALFNPRRREGWWRDAPLVLALTFLSLPIAVPGVIGVSVSLVVYALAEVLSGGGGDKPMANV